MFQFVLIIELLVTLAMIGAILLQRSEGGALGMGGGGGGGGGLMSSRGAGNALSRGTGILAAMFFLCSITLAILAKGELNTGLDYDAETGEPIAPVTDTLVPASDDTPALPGAIPSDSAETGTGALEENTDGDIPALPGSGDDTAETEEENPQENP